ncbi:LytR/AlgR family response regulator transcription factor [Spirosoma rhododendri]|uniref:LytTR family transcriptional regulator n=1 Tax=Spirosoma rhododendri TaxID=2728024 RepID=A0A7L5DP85_9BACT|nr:LytTR family DNA-binding domain-containing protein [Spirosoma rhododendri]QJD80304.1 LytTR family transcriptional regulator [Spirosoma rhododendri]
MSILLNADPRRSTTPEYMPSLRVNDTKAGWHSKPVNELIMIKGERGYSWLYWSDGSKQIMAYTIKHYADRLPENDFLRVHQNHVVNQKFVRKTLLTHRGPVLRMACGAEIIVSRRRWTMVKKALQHLSIID